MGPFPARLGKLSEQELEDAREAMRRALASVEWYPLRDQVDLMGRPSKSPEAESGGAAAGGAAASASEGHDRVLQTVIASHRLPELHVDGQVTSKLFLWISCQLGMHMSTKKKAKFSESS